MELKCIDEALLLVDLRLNTGERGLETYLHSFPIVTVPEVLTVQQAVSTLKPKAIYFEFDYPELQGLRELLKTRSEFPEIPVVMITSFHSENLAVWALRSRVWDYLVNPLDEREVIERVKLLKDGNSGKVQPPQPIIPKEVRFYNNRRHNKRTLAAVGYIYVNYSEKITLAQLAQLCKLCPAQFCVTFKRENGTTFQDFLLTHRIARARQLLGNTSLQITDVAYSVGFNDLSYFAKMFKRHVGLKPSAFQSDRYANGHLAARPLGEAPNNLAESMET